MTPPLLSLQNISAGYGKKAIVQDISFDIYEGEFCALLGLNGSGKTTLLKAICGLLPVESGRCMAGGKDCTGLGEKKRARYISYIPQRHSKMIGVTVTDAVLMGLNPRLGLLEFPSRSDEESALIALDKIGIADLARKVFSELSEGQKQMVILARMLVQDAPVMLMDEPGSSLDFLNQHRVLGRMRGLIHSEGVAGIMALHEPNLALGYCDRLILLDHGKKISDVRLADADADDIKECLLAIYGDITLLEHNGKYIVLI